LKVARQQHLIPGQPIEPLRAWRKHFETLTNLRKPIELLVKGETYGLSREVTLR
jgi:hypothetical protein